jgi:hypothetical protein
VREALYAAMSRFRQDQNCKDSKNPCDAKCNVMHWPDNGCTGAAASGIEPRPEQPGPQQPPASTPDAPAQPPGPKSEPRL